LRSPLRRIQLCQTSAGSAGARDFVLSTYAQLKAANPAFPILIREASGVQARLVARYDFGREEAVVVEGMNSDDVARQVEALVKRGETMPRSAESQGELPQPTQ
jgi:NADH dehydrogenase (ubiquinone) 1 alpha subcomplex subunit 2